MCKHSNTSKQNESLPRGEPTVWGTVTVCGMGVVGLASIGVLTGLLGQWPLVFVFSVYALILGSAMMIISFAAKMALAALQGESMEQRGDM